MLVSWTARGEAGQLTGAERIRPPARLAGDRLMSGFYANELLLKLLPRHDPNPALFEAYGRVVAGLQDPLDAIFGLSFLADSPSDRVPPGLLDELAGELRRSAASVTRRSKSPKPQTFTSALRPTLLVSVTSNRRSPQASTSRPNSASARS